jgi:hypothetical protein
MFLGHIEVGDPRLDVYRCTSCTKAISNQSSSPANHHTNLTIGAGAAATAPNKAKKKIRSEMDHIVSEIRGV